MLHVQNLQFSCSKVEFNAKECGLAFSHPDANFTLEHAAGKCAAFAHRRSFDKEQDEMSGVSLQT